MARADQIPNSWAITTLLGQGMPAANVRLLMHTDDPVIVRRHLELHRESMAERLEIELRTVDRLERVLVIRSDVDTSSGSMRTRLALVAPPCSIAP
jgi:hypothetical protein